MNPQKKEDSKSETVRWPRNQNALCHADVCAIRPPIVGRVLVHFYRHVAWKDTPSVLCCPLGSPAVFDFLPLATVWVCEKPIECACGTTDTTLTSMVEAELHRRAAMEFLP